MKIKFTQLIKLHDINTTSIDLLADAYGYDKHYHQLVELLSSVRIEPDKRCVEELIGRISNW